MNKRKKIKEKLNKKDMKKLLWWRNVWSWSILNWKENQNARAFILYEIRMRENGYKDYALSWSLMSSFINEYYFLFNWIFLFLFILLNFHEYWHHLFAIWISIIYSSHKYIIVGRILRNVLIIYFRWFVDIFYIF